MAISVTSLQVESYGWAKVATSADATACEEIIAAPAAGVHLILEAVTIYSAAAITVTIGAGVTSGGVTTAVLGPIAMAAGSTFAHKFVRPIILTAATSMTVDASGAGAIAVLVEGRTE